MVSSGELTDKCDDVPLFGIVGNVNCQGREGDVDTLKQQQ